MSKDGSTRLANSVADSQRPINVGVFGDARTCGPHVCDVINGHPALDVSFCANSLAEARQFTVKHKPEVFVLQCDSLSGDGLVFLKELNRNWPTPVIVLNSETEAGSDIAMMAFQNGAHKIIEMSPRQGTQSQIAGKICRTVWPLVRNTKMPSETSDDVAAGSGHSLNVPVDPICGPIGVIAIAASTGGLRSLGRVLDTLPPSGPPIIVVQHIKEGYIARTASRFDHYYNWKAGIAVEGQLVRNNHLIFAPDAEHLRVENVDGVPVVRLITPDEKDHFVPAANHLFDSVATAFGPSAVGVILTGMGKDGAEGMLRLRQTGARCIGENESSCIVYGMPKAAKSLGAVDLELSAEEIGLYLGQLIKQSSGGLSRDTGNVSSAHYAKLTG